MADHPPAGSPVAEDEEFTVDELAARAGMTVRNVRAYAARGLMPPPRLEGRTGYYNREHLRRLQVVREFIDRGYTLAAVEQAVSAAASPVITHTLDLLQIIGEPGQEEPERMSRDALAALAGTERGDQLIHAMAEHGLVRWVDDVEVELLEPVVVRSGAAAASLGLSPESVIDLYPQVRENLRNVADEFVGIFVEQIVQPFLDAGLPEDQWQPMLDSIERLLPVAGQVTLAIFRSELAKAIDDELGQQIDLISSRQRTRNASS